MIILKVYIGSKSWALTKISFTIVSFLDLETRVLCPQLQRHYRSSLSRTRSSDLPTCRGFARTLDRYKCRASYRLEWREEDQKGIGRNSFHEMQSKLTKISGIFLLKLLIDGYNPNITRSICRMHISY